MVVSLRNISLLKSSNIIRIRRNVYIGRDGWGEVLDGKLSKNAEYEANQRNMSKIVADFIKETNHAMMGGGQKAIEKHKARGKMLARERIDGLIDKGTPFLGRDFPTPHLPSLLHDL